jgi:hypothetical protein
VGQSFPTTIRTSISNIDGRTGKTTISWDVVLKVPGERHIIHNSYWPMSYHPGKNSLYIPCADDCLDMTRAAPAPAQADGQRGESAGTTGGGTGRS